MKEVAIVGATGYTAMELIRVLVNHPQVTIKEATSNSKAGKHITEIFPHLQGLCDLVLTETDSFDPSTVDLVFLGLPHGISMDFVKKHGLEKSKIVDLSGDFRLSSPELYNEWYPREHVYPEGYNSAVYGMPELFREDIRDAVLVANPGCYPTSAILPTVPLIKEQIVDPSHLIIDSKSGITGAGANPKPNTHFPFANDNFAAYSVKTHRHTPEIQDVNKRFTGTEPMVQFTPHLLPISRGILTTTYSILISDINEEQLRNVYQNYYGDEPFIRLVNQPPQLQHVRGSNFCDIFVTIDERTGHVITVSCIDNMMKGASGAAVQNMNIMMGFDESTGLNIVPLTP